MAPFLRPAVFRFQVVVVTGKERREFTFHTNSTWEELHREVHATLGKPAAMELLCRLTGDAGSGWSRLASAQDHVDAMSRVYTKASSARTRPVGLEIRNSVSPAVHDASMMFKMYSLQVQLGSDCATANGQVEEGKEAFTRRRRTRWRGCGRSEHAVESVQAA